MKNQQNINITGKKKTKKRGSGLGASGVQKTLDQQQQNLSNIANRSAMGGSFRQAANVGGVGRGATVTQGRQGDVPVPKIQSEAGEAFETFKETSNVIQSIAKLDRQIDEDKKNLDQIALMELETQLIEQEKAWAEERKKFIEGIEDGSIDPLLKEDLITSGRPPTTQEALSVFYGKVGGNLKFGDKEGTDLMDSKSLQRIEGLPIHFNNRLQKQWIQTQHDQVYANLNHRESQVRLVQSELSSKYSQRSNELTINEFSNVIFKTVNNMTKSGKYTENEIDQVVEFGIDIYKDSHPEASETLALNLRQRSEQLRASTARNVTKDAQKWNTSLISTGIYDKVVTSLLESILKTDGELFEEANALGVLNQNGTIDNIRFTDFALDKLLSLAMPDQINWSSLTEEQIQSFGFPSTRYAENLYRDIARNEVAVRASNQIRTQQDTTQQFLDGATIQTNIEDLRQNSFYFKDVSPETIELFRQDVVDQIVQSPGNYTTPEAQRIARETGLQRLKEVEQTAQEQIWFNNQTTNAERFEATIPTLAATYAIEIARAKLELELGEGKSPQIETILSKQSGPHKQIEKKLLTYSKDQYQKATQEEYTNEVKNLESRNELLPLAIDYKIQNPRDLFDALINETGSLPPLMSLLSVQGLIDNTDYYPSVIYDIDNTTVLDKSIAEVELVTTQSVLNSNYGERLRNYDFDSEMVIWKITDEQGGVHFRAIDPAANIDNVMWDFYNQQEAVLKRTFTEYQDFLGNSNIAGPITRTPKQVTDLVGEAATIKTQIDDLSNLPVTSVADQRQRDFELDELRKKEADAKTNLLAAYNTPSIVENLSGADIIDSINAENVDSLGIYADVFLQLPISSRDRLINVMGQGKDKRAGDFLFVLSNTFQFDGEAKFAPDEITSYVINNFPTIKQDMEKQEKIREIKNKYSDPSQLLQDMQREGKKDGDTVVDNFTISEEFYLNNMQTRFANTLVQNGILTEDQAENIEDFGTFLAMMDTTHQQYFVQNTFADFAARYSVDIESQLGSPGVSMLSGKELDQELTQETLIDGRPLGEILTESVRSFEQNHSIRMNSNGKLMVIADPNDNLQLRQYPTLSLSQAVDTHLAEELVTKQIDYSILTGPDATLLGDEVSAMVSMLRSEESIPQDFIDSLFFGIIRAMQDDGASLANGVYTEELSKRWYAHPSILEFVSEYQVLNGNLDGNNPVLNKLLNKLTEIPSPDSSYDKTIGYGLEFRSQDLGFQIDGIQTPMYRVSEEAPAWIPGKFNPDFTWETEPQRTGLVDNLKYAYTPALAIDDVVTMVGNPSRLDPEEWNDILEAIHTPGMDRLSLITTIANYTRGIQASDLMDSEGTQSTERESLFKSNVYSLEYNPLSPDIMQSPQYAASYIQPTGLTDEETKGWINFYAGTPVVPVIDGVPFTETQFSKEIQYNALGELMPPTRSNRPFIRVYNQDTTSNVRLHNNVNHIAPRSLEDLESRAGEPMVFYSADVPLGEFEKKDIAAKRHLLGRINYEERATLILPDKKTLQQSNTATYTVERRFDNQNGLVELHYKPKQIKSNKPGYNDILLNWDSQGNVWITSPAYRIGSTFSLSGTGAYGYSEFPSHVLQNYVLHPAAETAISRRRKPLFIEEQN